MSASWLILQLADSAFPTGGFAHSAGLEAAWQLGEVAAAGGLEAFFALHLDHAGHTTLPFVTGVHAQPERFVELDQLLDAMTTNHVANRASRVQGQAWLATACASLGNDALHVLKQRTRAEHLPTHLAAAFGAVCRHLDVVLADAQRLFLFNHLRALSSTAVRLGAIGPLAAQALQHRLAPVLDATLAGCADTAPEDAAATAPLLDLIHGHHDRLYSRLFSS